MVRTHFRTIFAAIPLLLGACRENLSTPPPGFHPDTSGPAIQLAPGHDTLVDSTGTLIVRVSALDASGLKQVDITISPPTVNFTPTLTHDTTLDVLYPIPLSAFKHGTFQFSAHGVDVLDHQTFTQPVTVTVK